MDLQTLDQLEQRITELADKFLELKEGHQRAVEEIQEKEKEIEQLHVKLEESQQTRLEANTKIEKIIKKIEFLRTQVDLSI